MVADPSRDLGRFEQSRVTPDLIGHLMSNAQLDRSAAIEWAAAHPGEPYIEPCADEAQARLIEAAISVQIADRPEIFVTNVHKDLFKGWCAWLSCLKVGGVG